MVWSAAVTTEPTWADRVRGALVLSACADALGAFFEGMTHVDPSSVDRWLDPPAGSPQLAWTDDTALALVVAEHLVRRRGTVDQAELAAELTLEWSKEPNRGYGAGARLLFGRIARGVAWRQAAADLFDGAGSWGNGAAMRSAPVGLVPGLGLSAVAGRARLSAAVTHAHPLGQDGAVAQAVAVALAARSQPGGSIDVEGVVSRVAAHLSTTELSVRMRQVPALVRERAKPARVAAEFGTVPTALATVPAALAAYFLHPDDPRAAIRFGICVGGDTDTVAAMTGALVGARRGEGALVPGWVGRLRHGHRVWATAARLAGLADGVGLP